MSSTLDLDDVSATSPEAMRELAEMRAVLIRARALLKSTRFAFGRMPDNAYATHLDGRYEEVIADIDRLVPRVRGERENNSPTEANAD